MTALFIDTAGWVAAADASDAACCAVRAERDHWLEDGGILVTSNYVCDETLTLLRLRVGLSAAEAWWQQIDRSRRLRLERVDVRREGQARATFFRYRDKQFSFTDCTSFVIMRELAIATALTLDQHFRQMGFRVLPE